MQSLGIGRVERLGIKVSCNASSGFVSKGPTFLSRRDGTGLGISKPVNFEIRVLLNSPFASSIHPVLIFVGTLQINPAPMIISLTFSPDPRVPVEMLLFLVQRYKSAHHVFCVSYKCDASRGVMITMLRPSITTRFCLRWTSMTLPWAPSNFPEHTST